MKTDRIVLKIGIAHTEKIADFLHRLLASTYALYIKTQNFHWNVLGTSFLTFHSLFQTQYEELAETIDEIAERIRALGFFPEGSLSSFAHLSRISDETQHPKKPMQMIATLLDDHETLICYLRENIALAESLKDGSTADFINKRLATHEKAVWMLRSILSD